MKLPNASLLIAMLAATAACKSEAPKHKPVAPVTQSGSDTGGSAAQASDPWTNEAPKKDPLNKPLFWSIERDGKASYLLGTMHLGIDPTTRLPDVVWQKLDDSKTFAMEADVSSAKLDVLRKDGTTLQQELGDDYWKKLEAALGVEGAARYQNMKPMLPATELSMRGLPRTPAMDGVLHGRALNKNKKIVFLESFEHQASILLKWLNGQALKDMLDDLAGIEARSKEMLDAYIAGDEAKILAIADSERERHKKRGRPEKEYDEQMDDLLYKRNAAWIAPIEKLHADGGGFIAVGAMHAIGPRSVIELLEKQGYKVTRITP